MARYICPSCGKRYNGKRCRSCMYENFAEEYTHGNHTHTGEPLVIRAPQRKPIPRKDPFDCEKKTRKPGLRPWVLLIILLSVIGPVVQMIEGIVSEIRAELPTGIFYEYHPEPDAVMPSDFPADFLQEPVMPSGGITLYDDGLLRIVADWEETRRYEDGIRVVVENHTQQDLNVLTRGVLVNGYLMNDSSLYCAVEAGHTAEGWLSLDSTDLEDTQITDVQQISASFEAYDFDYYETLIQTEFIPLCTTNDLNQAKADQGEVLWDQNGIRLVCKGFDPNRYGPETFCEGDLLFYLENETDETVEFYTDGVIVNGQDTYLSLWCSLPPHTRTIQRMYLFSLDDEELGIQTREDVTEMLASFVFRSVDSGDAITTDPLSLPFRLDYTN